MTWIKVLGLFCLLGWVFSWAVAAVKEQTGRDRLGGAGLGALGALVVGVAAIAARRCSSAADQLTGPLRSVPVVPGRSPPG